MQSNATQPSLPCRKVRLTSLFAITANAFRETNKVTMMHPKKKNSRMTKLMAPKAIARSIPQSGIPEPNPRTGSKPIVHASPRESKVSIVREKSELEMTDIERAAPHRTHRMVKREYQSLTPAPHMQKRLGIDCFSCCISLLCCLLLIALCFHVFWTFCRLLRIQSRHTGTLFNKV